MKPRWLIPAGEDAPAPRKERPAAGRQAPRRQPQSAFHRSPPAGSDGGPGPGRRTHGLSARNAATTPSLTARRASSEAATSRRREPLPHCQEQPVPVSCLPVPGKDLAGLTRAWTECGLGDSPPHAPQAGRLGMRRHEGPSCCPSVTPGPQAGVRRGLEFRAPATIAKPLPPCPL